MTDAAARYVHRRAVYNLVVDGKSINDAVMPRLISLSLDEKGGTDADELTIVLDDRDGRVDIPPAGAVITLKMGWLELRPGATAQLVDKGSFKVDDRSHDGSPDRLTISAKSADLAHAFRNRRTGTWSNTTLGQILDEVAARNGLRNGAEAAKAAIAVAHMNQSRESDAAFLGRLGRLYDATATVKAGTLLFSAIGGGRSASGLALPAVTISRKSGDRHRWKAAERDNYSGVIVEWHDRASATRHQLVEGSADNAKRLGRTYASEASARRAAKAHRAKADRKGATFGLQMAAGDPALYPGVPVTVSGWKAVIDETPWSVTTARHTLDSGGGLTSSIELETKTAAATTR